VVISNHSLSICAFLRLHFVWSSFTCGRDQQVAWIYQKREIWRSLCACVYHRINERHRSGMPCCRILNEMYTDLEVSRSHETILDKATLTCRSADRKVISGQLAEWSSLKSDIISIHSDIDFPRSYSWFCTGKPVTSVIFVAKYFILFMRSPL